MAVSAAASVSRRSRLRRSSLAASSAARRESRVEKSSMTSEATSMRPAALMRGARRKATSKPVSCLAAGSSAAAANSARRPAPTGRRSSRRPRAAMMRFSPRRGTASAMVAMAAILRKLGSVFSRVRAGSRRSSTACASLSAMAAPQSDFSGYGQPGWLGFRMASAAGTRVVARQAGGGR